MENDTKSKKKFPAFIKYFILLLIAAYIALSTIFAPFIEKMEKKRYHKNIMTVADYVFSHDFPTNRSIELSDFPKKSAAYKAFKKMNCQPKIGQKLFSRMASFKLNGRKITERAVNTKSIEPMNIISEFKF